MLGSGTVRHNRRRALAVAIAVLAPLLALAPPAAANLAPEVQGASVTPSTLPYWGGNVDISAFVYDFEGGFVDFVYLEVTDQYGTSQGPALSQGSTDWFGTYQIPPNLSGVPLTYQFTVVARDTDLAEGRGYAGSVVVAAGPPTNEPPVVSEATVTPRDLPSAGGPVKLGFKATSVTEIREVFADVAAPGAAPTRVNFAPVGGDRYEGTFTAPANAGTGTVEYRVAMVAYDAVGLSTSVDAGLIRVVGRPSGRLEIRTAAVDFGTTQVGKRRQRSVTVRNVGAKTTLPVQGVLTTSGAPFFVAGAPTTGLPFCLRAGETMNVQVEFRPTAAGVRTGTLRVTRPDLVQPTLTLPLRGEGIQKTQTVPALSAPEAVKTCR
jgi:centrosomal CEP192-like protein